MKSRLVNILMIVVFAHGTAEAQEKLSTEEVVGRAMNSIVAIRAVTPDGSTSGTGFLVDSSGVIVTNLHVIEGATQLGVKLHSGEEYTHIKIASFDKQRDLAVIRIPGFGLPTLHLANSEDVQIGATVFAVGNPLGLEESVTKGIVSSIRVGDDGIKVIQTDTAVSPGNSGGPLIDENGSVIGVVTFKIRGGENINFAMPINYARALIDIETLMSLDEFSRELGKQTVSLFSDSADSANGMSATGTWLSLVSNTRRQLIQDGEFLYGSQGTDSGSYAYDLKLQADGSFKGVARLVWEGTYPSAWDGSTKNVQCSTEDEIEIRLVSPTRLEGRFFYAPWPKKSGDQKKYVKSCGQDFAKSWEDFVWVRVN